jgi:hypothetical protein
LQLTRKTDSLFNGNDGDKLGDGWHSVVHPDDLTSTVANGINLSTQAIHSTDGSWRLMRARATARRGINGIIFGWYGLIGPVPEDKPDEEVGIVS